MLIFAKAGTVLIVADLFDGDITSGIEQLLINQSKVLSFTLYYIADTVSPER